MNIFNLYKATSNAKLSGEIIAIIVGLIIIVLIPIITLIIKRVALGKGKVDEMTPVEKMLSLHEELDINKILNNKKYSFKGVYIIFNDTKQRYFISSSDNVSDALNNQFNGIGNATIYNDYKYGDKFKIKIVGLKDSKYTDLKKLEKDIKEVYSSFSDSYNQKKKK